MPFMADDLESAVLRALRESTFPWRTAGGIAEEVNVSADDVERILVAHSDVFELPVPTADGQRRFTTRDLFRENASILDRLAGSLKNRIA